MTRTFSVLALFVVPVVVVAAFTFEIRRGPVSPGVLATALTAVALWETSPRAVVFEVFATRVGNQTGFYAPNPYAVQTVALAAEYVVPAVLALLVCAVSLWIQGRRNSVA